MYSDFKRAFKDEPTYKTEIPQLVLDVLSADLPKGFKYVDAENGVCRIDTEEFVIGIDNIVLPSSAKEVLPVKITMSDVWTYLYNAQKKVKVCPDEKGYFKINGKLIKAEDLIKCPFENIENYKSEFYLIPHPFPESFIMTIGTEDKKYEMKIPVKRQAYESLDIKKFESADDSPIKLTWFVDEMNDKFTFNIKTRIENTKTIQEIVDMNYIYNAFVSGKGTISDLVLPIDADREGKIISDDVIEFWDKVLEIEKYFDVKFVPGEEITADLVNIINEIYQCYIKRKPFKKYQNFTEFSGSVNSEIKNMKPLIGNELYFEMTVKEKVTLLNVELEFSGLMGIFDSMVKSIENNNDDSHTIYVEPMKGKKMYSSTIYLKDELTIEEYKSKPTHINELKDAVELSYL